MKRLLTSRILTCLIFLTIWGSKTYAQSSNIAGTETFEITSSTKIPKQSTEYQYYASANISLFIGADEVWKNEEIFSGKYYLSSGGNMGIKQDKDQKKQTDAGYYEAEKTTDNSACIALPNTGNYFHFLFHTKGKIKLAFNAKYKFNPAKPDEINQKYLYVEKATNKPVTVVDKKNNYYTTRRGITPSSIKVTATTETTIEPQESDDNKYFKIIGVGGDHPMVIEFDADAGDEYCIWMSSAEEFAIGGFTFDVDESQLFTPWKPVVHRQIEYGKNPNEMKNADGNAPSGVEDITFMYGGWTNHPNAVKAATWNETEKTWGFNENGTVNTTYNVNNESKMDKWEEVKAESETTDNLVTLDGYTKFTPGCGQVPTDQYGKAFDPTQTSSATPSVANIPCRGTYYKFEPAKDGTLNVYVRQAANSPLYLVDETGKPQKSIDYKAGNDAKFTEGTDASYIIDKLAACRYGFEVQAGKTYVLFQNNEMLGFYGFTFGASSTAETTVSISQTDGYTYEAKNNATVTLTKPLKANVWNAICLPFSMTEQQVRNAFGEDARIAEFKKVDESGKKAVASFGMNYYQLITAGKPCLIKPSQVNDTYTIKGVTINAEQALTIADSNKKFDFVGTYAPTTMPANSHFLGSNEGKLYYITANKEISGLKAFFQPVSTSNAKLSIAFDSTDNDFDNNTTGIEAIKDYMDQDTANSSANKGIYNINGQFMGTNPAILPQGIYVKDGKKFIVK
uniref:hypothetical protein n=1 Tax=Segatella hominis TaxID=2518605 RepID=UPI004038F391